MEHLTTREKIQNMNRKEKLEYFKEYYKSHALVALIAIVVVSYIIVGLINRKDMVLNVTFYGRAINIEKHTELSRVVNEDLVAEKKQQIRLDFIMTDTSAQLEVVTANFEKLIAMVAARDLDILILSKDDFNYYAEDGFFYNLSSIPGFSKLNLKEYEMVYDKLADDATAQPYGISINGSPILDDLEFASNDPVLAILANSQRLDKSLEFIQWFLNH
jgi:hypothetical protein